MYFWLWVMFVAATVAVGQAYHKYYKEFEKLCTPHPFILASLITCTCSLWFELMHCWWYASDG
jgi:TRAP-type C4-dicarboxylate transport system permease small subunit